MERKYAEAYVKWREGNKISLNTLSMMTWVYSFLAGLALYYAFTTKRFFFASCMVVVVVAHGIITEICKQRVRQWTYVQTFLLPGISSLSASVVFLLLALVLVETATVYGVWYYSLIIGLWLVTIALYIYIPWKNVRNGTFYVAQQRHNSHKWSNERIDRRGASVLGIGALAGIMGQSFARSTLSQASSGVVANVAIWAFQIVAMIMGMGSSNLLKAYYVKKYDIKGKSVPVWWMGDGAGKPVSWRVLDALKKMGKAMAIIVVLCVILTLVLAFFIRWLPEWQERI